MANFIALFHAKAFLLSRISVIAPKVYHQYIADMQWYRDTDKITSDAAIQSCNRHLWYLTEELVIFAMFDDEMSPIERSDMALKLYDTQRSEEIKPGKPSFPKVDGDNIPSFASLIGPRSWLLFNLIKMTAD